MGIEQFIPDDELTQDLIKEGRDLVKREKNKRIKNIETGQNRERWTASASTRQQVVVQAEPVVGGTTARSDNARLELLNDVEPVDYSTTWTTDRRGFANPNTPQKGIFDDI